MSLAAETRRAARRHPFLVAALRAGVVNYTAAARFLAVEGETDAIATALRRYAEELPARDTEPRDVRVRMESGVGPVDAGADEALVSVGGTAYGPDGGDRTAIVATGAVDAAALAAVLERLALEGIDPVAAGVDDGEASGAPRDGDGTAGAPTLVVVVDRLEGANALRAVEGALEDVPVPIE